MDRNFTPASPATARASRVLPVPGGPTKSTPLGMRAPRSMNFWGSLRKSTSSCNSCFSSSAPATSAKVTVLSLPPSTARACPKRLGPGPPPPWEDCCCRAFSNAHSPRARAAEATQGMSTTSHSGVSKGLRKS